MFNYAPKTNRYRYLGFVLLDKKGESSIWRVSLLTGQTVR